MFDYLDKFNNLNPELKQTVSSAEAVNVIEKLEKEFNVDLASIIMRVMTKDIYIDSLPLVLFTELRLNQEKSEILFDELKKQVFYKSAKYLGLSEALPDKSSLEESKISEAPKKSEIQKIPEKTEKVEGIKDETRPEKQLDSPDSQYSKDIKNLALEIFINLNLKFSSEDKIKFLSIIEKYLRGVKDRLDVRQVLITDKKNGGLSLSDEVADNIFILIRKINNEKYQSMKKNIKVEDDILTKINKLSHGQIIVESDYKLLAPENFSHQLESPTDILIAGPVEDLNKALDEAPIKDPVETLDEAPIKDPVEILDETLVNAPMNALDNVIENKKEVSPVEEKKNPPLPEGIFDLNEKPDDSKLREDIEKKASAPPKSRGRVNMVIGENGKIKMSDIKKVKVTNPVEELKYMDLVNFRRLDQSPVESFNKIKQKLKVLENVDYGKMLEGIKSWRQSPVNRLYLKILLKSGNEGLSIDQAIESLKRANQDYLSREEINALIDFNKSLNF